MDMGRSNLFPYNSLTLLWCSRHWESAACVMTENKRFGLVAREKCSEVASRKVQKKLAVK